MINQCDKRFMVYSKTAACTCERLSSHSSHDFWLRCWKDRSSGKCSKLHASRVTILEFLTKISCNSRENSRLIPASSTQNPCEFWGIVEWKTWNIHAGYLKIRSFRRWYCSIPQVKSTRYGLRSFHYEAARIWNCLPNDFRKAESFPQFRRLLHAWDGIICKCPSCSV